MRLKVDIVGAGIIGLCAAWALQRRGHQVRVYEQAAIPNPLGSSVDQHRLIRYPYGDQDGYVRMVAEAYAAWDQLWRDLGRKLQIETGTLAFDTGGDDWANRSRASLDRCGIAYRMLQQNEVAQRFRFLDATGIRHALHLETGGILLAEPIVAALARHLAASGVALHAHAGVADLDPARARLRLADGRDSEADVLLVAAGPWLPKLLPDFARKVTPSRQVLTYLQPPAQHAAAWAGAPMILAIGEQAGFYAVPPAGGTGLKIGDHRFSLLGDPDRERDAGDAEAQTIAGQARARFRDGADYRLIEAKTCFYDVAAGEAFLVEPLGTRCWVASGFSGHGFKFGAVVGQRLAAALAGEIPAAALSQWAAGQGEIG